MVKNELLELFVTRATAATCRVVRVATEEAVAAVVADVQARPVVDCGGVGVVRAARGVATTGTCVVETDAEETRLQTMLPEISVIVLKASDIVEDLSDLASYLRTRQSNGKISYTSFITGPSRTADIERVSAIGVHGPLELHIILVED